MPVAKAQTQTNTQTQTSFVRQGKFATSKLIQNLGSNPEQYQFEGNLRNVHGRD